jgi:hypothetical protein
MVHLHLLDTPTIGWWFHRWVWRLLGQHVEPQPIQSCPKMGISVYPKSHDMFFFGMLDFESKHDKHFFSCILPPNLTTTHGFSKMRRAGGALEIRQFTSFCFFGEVDRETIQSLVHPRLLKSFERY